MVKVVITTTLHMTPEQFKSDKVQELLNDIKSGKAKRELNEGRRGEKNVEKITMSYWTDAKNKL